MAVMELPTAVAKMMEVMVAMVVMATQAPMVVQEALVVAFGMVDC
jgi:hypothetical protein